MSNKDRIRYRPRIKRDLSDVEVKDKAYYIDLVGDFQSLLPPPIIQVHDGVEVLRDDLLGLGGSKTRFAELLVAKAESDTIVYPSLSYSYICLALIELCKLYDKKLILIMPNLPQKRKQEVGVIHEYCVLLQKHMPNLFCYQIRAKHKNRLSIFAKDVADNLKATLIPNALKHDLAMAMIVKTAISIPAPTTFTVSVGTGMLINGLQLAWPDAQANGIAIRNLYPDVGYANMRSHYIWRNRGAHILPPFPSTTRVDAKIWEYLKPGDFFWNVTKDIQR